jgi:hypothetical protein
MRRRRSSSALLAAHGDPGAAARSAEEERLRRIDHEFGEWLAHLCDVLDEEFMGGPATNELSELGALAVPSLERELMRPYRFPIGSDATYMELVICLGRIGRDAWPVLAASHWHWRGHGFTDATPAWQTVAPENADILVPMTAMRLVHDAALGTTFESFAHLASDRDVETHLRPIWRALGPTGKAARGELAAHPLCSVRDAARRVEP